MWCGGPVIPGIFAVLKSVRKFLH